jgi:hypothetical protein
MLAMGLCMAQQFDRLPDMDVRRFESASEARLTPDQERAASQLRSRVPALHIDVDPIVGGPSWIISRNGFLSGPTELEILRQGRLGLADDDPDRAVKALLIENAELFGYGPEILSGAVQRSVCVTPHNGMRTVVWAQELDAIPVHGAMLVAHTTRNGELINVFTHMIPDLEKADELDVGARLELIAQPPVSAEEAVAAAAINIGESIDFPAEVISDAPAEDRKGDQRFVADGLVGEARARLVWLPISRSSLRHRFAVPSCRRAGHWIVRSVSPA